MAVNLPLVGMNSPTAASLANLVGPRGYPVPGTFQSWPAISTPQPALQADISQPTNYSSLLPQVTQSGSGDVLSALQGILGGQVRNIPMTSIPALNYTPPTSSDLQAKWKEFLDRAAKDPDIVNYYQKLLDQAKGDTEIAKGFITKDYEMNTRFTQENLAAKIEQLTGLTFPVEQQSLEESLNRRGIAMTDLPTGGVGYAGGGQAGTELSQLNESQKLRKEAEMRSAGQTMEQLGLKKTQGTTQAGQQLAQFGLSAQKAKETDIANRAGQYMGWYSADQAAQLLKAQQEQQQKMYGGGSKGSGDQDYKTLLAIESHGDLNPVQRTQLALKKQMYGA